MRITKAIACHFERSREVFLIAIVFFCLAFFLSCKNEAYEKQVRSLDSLSGALNQKLAELKQIDTVILQKAITRFVNYKQFIQQNVNDTVSKTEANSLQQFYSSGKNLLDFDANRKTMLARGSLINSQLTKLIIDAKENAVEEEKLNQFSNSEKLQAEQLIKSTFGQQQLFNANLQEFKLSISGVEEVIKSRNNGQLPTVIKEQADL